ncbi:conserved hypothetical protein [Gammaproteobacteria bacterium]
MPSLPPQSEAVPGPDGWVPVFWEPVAHTSERLMVGVMVRFQGELVARRILRDNVLNCLYGKKADKVESMIDAGLADLRIAAKFGMDNLPAGTFGLTCGPFHATQPWSVSDALRVAAQMYSSLANIQTLDELEESDAPTPEAYNRRFTALVRAEVTALRPDLSSYFGRAAPLLEHGELVRFGYCSPRTAIHFSVFNPKNQPGSVRDARARIFELFKVRDYASLPGAALVISVPHEDDPLVTKAQTASLKRNLVEIEREAVDARLQLFPVVSPSDGAKRLIEQE